MYKVLIQLLAVALLVTAVHSGVICDGVDDILTLSTDITTNSTYTVTAWVLPTTGSAATAAAFVYTDSPFNGLYFHGTPTVYWSIYSGGSAGSFDSNITTLDVVHHVALVSNAGSGVFYLDGIADTTGSVDTTTQFHRVCNDPVGEAFTGTMLNIALYDTALTAQEVQSLAAGKLQNTALTRARQVLYMFDNCADGASGDAVVFVDRSGNGNNVTGDNGANNTGLVCAGSSYLSYIWGAN